MINIFGNIYKIFSISYLKYKLNKLFYINNTEDRLSVVYKEFYQKYIKHGVNLEYINEKSLKLNHYDDRINEITKKRCHKTSIRHKNDIDNSKLAILFTEIYHTGGHTALIERIAESFYGEYNLKLFTTRLNSCKYGKYAKKKSDNITRLYEIDGVHSFWNDPILEIYVLKLYQKISLFNPKIIFCYVNPYDVVLVAVLALLKRYSKSKVIYINMQDHFYSLGFKFADLIVDFRPAGQDITTRVRGYKNTVLVPLQQRKKDKTRYVSKKEILELRSNIGIKRSQYFTLSGGSSYKYFNGNNSIYFKFIKSLLQSEPKLVHVIISNFDQKFKNIINNIFKDDETLLDRLKIVDLTLDYDPYMQSCDLFIDSFPQGAALTHIDLMRNKRPTIVKVNEKNPIRSFEFYLPKDYPCIYKNLENMKNGILEILKDKSLQDKLSQELYKHYLKKYEFYIVKDKYKQLIENSNNLEKFYGASLY